GGRVVEGRGPFRREGVPLADPALPRHDADQPGPAQLVERVVEAAAGGAGRLRVGRREPRLRPSRGDPAHDGLGRRPAAGGRAGGAVPATVAVWHGTPTVGLTPAQIEELAQAKGVLKASRRDLGAAVGLGQLAATTVSATMALAHAAGVRVFATGGIGGAHRGEEPFDISADLVELSRTPVLVACAGAKSILHLPRTLEILETLGVPVLGYRTDGFPQFYVRADRTALPVSARVDS